MNASCEMVKLNFQFHQEAAIFSVDAIQWKEAFLVATAGGDSCVRLWKYSYQPQEISEEFVYRTATTFQGSITHLATLKRHKGSVNCLRFNTEGTQLVTAGDLGIVYLWDINKILQTQLEEEDLICTEYYPIRVRESDGLDIYDIKWFKNKILIGTAGGTVEQYVIEANTQTNTSKKQKVEDKTESSSTSQPESQKTDSNQPISQTTTETPEISTGPQPETTKELEIAQENNHQPNNHNQQPKASETKETKENKQSEENQGNKQPEETKENKQSEEKKTRKFRIISETKTEPPAYKAKCISSKKAHKAIVQGVACTETLFATVGNDRMLKVFSETGQIIQKLTDKTLITDKHSLFFRRLAFDKSGTLYLPSATYDNQYTVNLLTPPEYHVTSAIGPFTSSTGCIAIGERAILVSEGRNIYVFDKNNTILFRVVDSTFLPITDICIMEDRSNYVSVLISSSDGFLTNLIIHIDL
ncbi:hypothetical protein NEOKW01_1838 [Nematocida sp. AWRm80]|nr:hypothetical protein NEOKW01_1838 [Nematocida sp. AWRm80]